MTSKAEYQFRREVEHIILDLGGVIFGGHVRDVILNDIHANDYYIDGVINKKSAEYASPVMYDDPTFLPQFDGRTVVSKDIDCYMPTHILKYLFQEFEDRNICAKVIFKHKDIKDYISTINVPDGVLSHMRCEISSISKHTGMSLKRLIRDNLHTTAERLLSSRISTFINDVDNAVRVVKPMILDIIVTKCKDFHMFSPPFSTVDFECNGLLLTKMGISLSPSLYPEWSLIDRHNKLDGIIDDIRCRRAVYVDPTSLTPQRISKMKSKGWTVVMRAIQQATVDASAQEMCIICHDDIAPYSICFKLKCCSAMYHRACLERALVSDNDYCMSCTGCCIMCKQSTTAFTEIDILKAE